MFNATIKGKQMKIKQEHYEYMVAAIKPLAPKLADHRKAIVAEGKANDVDMRLRWDAARCAGLIPFFCSAVYPYANDQHIDTALRAVMRELAS
jgi:hypothetical protein